jgi:hypothetical protein
VENPPLCAVELVNAMLRQDTLEYPALNLFDLCDQKSAVGLYVRSLSF